MSEMSDCRTLPSDTLTLSDTSHRPSLSESMSDDCWTVSDCRTVGLSEVSEMSEQCRIYVGKHVGNVGPRLSEIQSGQS